MYVILATDHYWFTHPVRYSPGEAKLHIWDDTQRKFLCDDRLEPHGDTDVLFRAPSVCVRCLRYARKGGVPLEEQG